MTALTRWHVGPWTTRGTRPGSPFEPGLKRTPDELNFDIVGLSRILGRRQTLPEEMLVRRCQAALRPTDPRPCGVQTLTDPDLARDLAETAERAFTWIAAQAPSGYEFALTDAVELRPLLDLDAPVVAIEAVIHQAAVPLPAARLATSHVRRSTSGHWYAGNAVCNWSGPHDTAAEATAAVQAAREDLVTQLQATGREDLARTASRWPPVPAEPA
ncbi:hypothetical protein E0H75_25360 [Kribbella capetownensis]|uniref:Uncharacterized protein n=1 Tax=Kribbella capetownensis TaxID=1572659 RepID=A0A4R0JKU3_9ACTN|nr:hypothetical protein [Kribbella capetownensis]TCC46414.1 hypothetical protein E0H75_25360 [Kribbella capetownensis]